jgi:hypothetical protein
MSASHPNQPLLRIRDVTSAERSRDRSLAYCVLFVGISEIAEEKAQASFWEVVCVWVGPAGTGAGVRDGTTTVFDTPSVGLLWLTSGHRTVDAQSRKPEVICLIPAAQAPR